MLFNRHGSHRPIMWAFETALRTLIRGSRNCPEMILIMIKGLKITKATEISSVYAKMFDMFASETRFA
jgi:hypothetical protein